jgi:hypothetical protein
MSGHAAIALVLIRDRGQLATLTICRLGEPLPPSQRESPFPVDFYLSWMSPQSVTARPTARPQLNLRNGDFDRAGAALYSSRLKCVTEGAKYFNLKRIEVEP